MVLLLVYIFLGVGFVIYGIGFFYELLKLGFEFSLFVFIVNDKCEV